MAIESASYISDLNTSNPPAGDPVGQACDHIRLVKACVKATFPNLTGSTSLTAEKASNGNIPTGGIILWSGAIAAIPTGWALCDGGTYPLANGSGNLVAPDLRDVMVMGGGLTYAPLAKGGAASNTPTIGVAGAGLTVDQLPSHAHGVNDPPHTHGIADPGHSHSYTYSPTNNVGRGSGGALCNSGGTATGTSASGTGISVYAAQTGISIQATGSGNPHYHSANSSAVPTIPPFVALGYIIRL